MNRTRFSLSLVAALVFTGLAWGQKGDAGAGRQAGPEGGIAGVTPTLTTVQIASGLVLPVGIAAPPGDNNRLFVIEQRSGSTGRVRVINIGQDPPTLSATVYLSVPSLNTGNEEGLLGIAFHPNFLSNGYFYLYYTSGGNNHVARYRANEPYATSTTANPTGTVILTLNHPTNSNHNGGWIGFAPNDTQGLLHIATGDGGSGNDPPNNAQNVNSLLGKMLRIDIDGADGIPGNDDDDGVLGNGSIAGYTNPPTNPYFGGTAGLDEILHIGLRNPWRCSFDRLTGDLYIGDVGQNAREEVSFAPAGATGRNFGWRCMEGLLCTGLSGCTCNAVALTNPIHTYTTTIGACVTGGYVYRGSKIPGLPGTYFFADHGQNNMWSFRYNGTSVTEFQSRNAQLGPVSTIATFGEDAAGEVYFTKRSAGTIWRIIPTPPVNNTCANATPVNLGSNPFSNVFATSTTIMENTLGCFNTNQVPNHVWYRYTAECNATLTVSLCDADLDARLAIYGPTCSTSPNLALACSENDCSVTGAKLSIPVTAGTVYRIRAGGRFGEWGTGTLVLECDVTPCPGDIAPGKGDGMVNVDDLVVLLGAWGPCDGCSSDLAPPGGDGQVNVDDLVELLGLWGPCQP